MHGPAAPNPAVPLSPTVFVVDHDEQTRSDVQSLLGSVGLAVEAYASAPEFLAAYDPRRPGCLILETRLPGLGGLDLQERLARYEISAPVIVITAYGDIPMAVRAMRNGAVDFLEKPFRPQVLLDRVYEALERDAVDRRTHALRGTLLARASGLTARERAVLDQVVAGETNKGMAARMGVGRKAIEAYRTRVMRTMEAHNLAELVRMRILLTHGVDVMTEPPGPLGPVSAPGGRSRVPLFEADDLVDRAARRGRTAPAPG